MKVIITEKLSVAGEIAEVLNLNTKQAGYMSNNEYCITWAYGHLIELCSREAYGWNAWTKDTLPMLPGNTFKIQPAKKYNSNTKTFIEDEGIQKQLSVIDELFSNCSEIIVATDAGRVIRNKKIRVFMSDITDYTKKITNEAIQIGTTLQNADLRNTKEEPIICPKCKQGHIKSSDKNYYCSNYPRKVKDTGTLSDRCNFVIWKTIAGKSITENTVKQISTRKKTSLIKGFKSKAGKNFEAFLVLNNEWKLEFEFNNKKQPV